MNIHCEYTVRNHRIELPYDHSEQHDCIGRNPPCSLCNTIGIKHDFPCINVCQVPKAEVSNISRGTWQTLMYWKIMFDRRYCIKSTTYLLKFGKLYGTIFCHRFAVSERVHIFSSPEPKAPGELIGWEGSVVRRPSSVVVVRPQFQTTSPLKLLGQL